jgi:hypothetical protein
MISRAYSVRDVWYLPYSALDSGLSCRSLSAHSLTVRSGGGDQREETFLVAAFRFRIARGLDL